MTRSLRLAALCTAALLTAATFVAPAGASLIGRGAPSGRPRVSATTGGPIAAVAATSSRLVQSDRAAGNYVLSVSVTAPAGPSVGGAVVQFVGGAAPQLRVANIIASSTPTTVTADVYVTGPLDTFQVMTVSPVQVGTITLTPAPPGLVVRGTQFISANGQPVLWYGINADPFETAADMADLKEQTGSTIVRIPTSECMWMSWSADYVPGYRQKIIDEVHAVTAAGMTAILDLHWACMDNPKYVQDGWNTYDQVDADQHSLLFWQDAASVFKNNPAVMFELFNEPQMQDTLTYSGLTGDQVWLNGGKMSYYLTTWQAPGMQQLYNVIRATGANNVVLVDGTDWASSLVPAMNDPLVGTNIAYAYHAYVHAGANPAGPSPFLDSDVAPAINPAGFAQAGLATEFGTETSNPTATEYFENTIGWMESHGTGWVVWGWYPAQNDPYGLLNAAGTAPLGRGLVVLKSL